MRRAGELVELLAPRARPGRPVRRPLRGPRADPPAARALRPRPGRGHPPARVAAQARAHSAADRLLRDEEQVRLLDYEIGLDLYKRVKKGAARPPHGRQRPSRRPTRRGLRVRRRVLERRAQGLPALPAQPLRRGGGRQMRRASRPWPGRLLASLPPAPPPRRRCRSYNLSSKANERTELVAKLRRDLVKVDRSSTSPRSSSPQSRSAPYLPDLIFRQAELYVEKSRYRFHLEAELNAEAEQARLAGGPRRHPAQAEGDQPLRAHPATSSPTTRRATRCASSAPTSTASWASTTRPSRSTRSSSTSTRKSPLVARGAADHRRLLLRQAQARQGRELLPEDPRHARPRPPTTWPATRWAGCGSTAASTPRRSSTSRPPPRSPVLEGAGAKALQVKGLALSDLVYSYTESRPAKGAIEYFEALCDNANAFENVLEKLGNRYFIKQEFENAAPAYRRLLVMSRDFERDPERASRLYETIKASKGKVVAPRRRRQGHRPRRRPRPRRPAHDRQGARGAARGPRGLLPRPGHHAAGQAQKAEEKLDRRPATQGREGREATRGAPTTTRKDESRRSGRSSACSARPPTPTRAYLDLFRNEKHRLNDDEEPRRVALQRRRASPRPAGSTRRSPSRLDGRRPRGAALLGAGRLPAALQDPREAQLLRARRLAQRHPPAGRLLREELPQARARLQGEVQHGAQPTTTTATVQGGRRAVHRLRRASTPPTPTRSSPPTWRSTPSTRSRTSRAWPTAGDEAARSALPPAKLRRDRGHPRPPRPRSSPRWSSPPTPAREDAVTPAARRSPTTRRAPTPTSPRRRWPTPSATRSPSAT